MRNARGCQERRRHMGLRPRDGRNIEFSL
jgi:hypothetical protein